MLREWTFQVFHEFGGRFSNVTKWIKVAQGQAFTISRNGHPFPSAWRALFCVFILLHFLLLFTGQVSRCPSCKGNPRIAKIPRHVVYSNQGFGSSRNTQQVTRSPNRIREWEAQPGPMLLQVLHHLRCLPEIKYELFTLFVPSCLVFMFVIFGLHFAHWWYLLLSVMDNIHCSQ